MPYRPAPSQVQRSNAPGIPPTRSLARAWIGFLTSRHTRGSRSNNPALEIGMRNSPRREAVSSAVLMVMCWLASSGLAIAYGLVALRPHA